MDLDLVTNGSFIKENINSLLSGKIVWIVLGYIGNQTITVVEVGGDSLEDMFEEFHGSKIMYGFASVTDPNTKLKKNIFIYWQGTGASQVMKTKSVQHSNVIRELFKSIHVTITARDEQDLDLKDIMLKVAAASGSNYSFHNENKQIFESQPSVKSEGNTANFARQERHKELASLSNIKKEVPTPIQKASNSTIPDISKHIKPALTNKATFHKGTNFVKTNLEKEVKSLNTNQKITYESHATIKSQNNTPDRAKEERQKELSQLLNRTFDDEPFQQVGTNYTKINPLADIQRLRRESQGHDTEIQIDPKVSHVSKVDPREEIIRLKRAGSTASEKDIDFNPITSSYKKIDPMSEIQELQRANKTIESDQCVSPSSTYKKINPAEEIKKLKSQSSITCQETTPVASNYKRINPTEEIIAAKSTYKISTEISKDNKLTQPVNTVTNEAKSARMTFENIHKVKVPEPHRQLSREQKQPSVIRDTHTKTDLEREIEVKIENQSTTFDDFSFDKNNHNFNNNQNTPVDKLSHEKVNNKFGFEEKIPSGKVNPEEVDLMSLVSKEKERKLSNTAVAIYEYQASDADEISFKVGELITEIDYIDEGWWLGYNGVGIKGMFPSNYVKLSKTVAADVKTPVIDDRNIDVQPEHEISENISNTENLPDVFLTVMAEYLYDAQDKDELSFQKGDKIYNVTKIDDGWWEGEMENGSKGMFPSNYVAII